MSTINFFRGHPTNYLLARKEVLEATTKLLSPETRSVDADENNRHPLTYGTDLGSLQVRQVIADWNGPKLGEKHNGVTADHICLTNGASFGAQNALTTTTNTASGYTRRGFIVSPTYFLINDVFLDNGFTGKLTSVLETEQGLDLVQFEKDLENDSKTIPADIDVGKYVGRGAREKRRFYRYVLYLIPSFSNPRGGVVSLDQRKRLLEIARKYDVLIFCDDVYDHLNYTGKPIPPRLVWLDRETLPQGDEFGHVISNCTFSKVVGPGLRVGWQETATIKLALQLSLGGSVRSGGSPAQLNSYIAAELINNGSLTKVIANLVSTYTERARHQTETLKHLLPSGTIVEGGHGGYFTWVTLPEKYRLYAGEISKLAKEQGVILAPGKFFEVDGDHKDWDASYRLCFGYLTDDESDKGIAIWANMLSSLGN